MTEKAEKKRGLKGVRGGFEPETEVVDGRGRPLQKYERRGEKWGAWGEGSLAGWLGVK